MFCFANASASFSSALLIVPNLAASLPKPFASVRIAVACLNAVFASVFNFFASLTSAEADFPVAIKFSMFSVLTLNSFPF
ncbi:MAG: hypothetical protein IPJ32_18515 [Sphingobacteriaceae bacterium]|nr:hypothetical protein [Sphingobacteriaceae bacterium]